MRSTATSPRRSSGRRTTRGWRPSSTGSSPFSRPPTTRGGSGRDDELTDELAELLDSVFLNSVPIAPRLLDLLEARGWRGWTKLERIRT